MAGISKSACIKLILKYIGGSPLMQVPTTTIGGSPVAARVGAAIGGAAGIAGSVAGVAAQAGSLQAGLAAIAKNPLGNVIEGTKSQLDGLVAGGFAGLDAALPTISGNPALSASYDKLKLALGGADGLSGATAQINRFQEHTNRLSGLVPSSDSEGL